MYEQKDVGWVGIFPIQDQTTRCNFGSSIHQLHKEALIIVIEIVFAIGLLFATIHACFNFKIRWTRKKNQLATIIPTEDSHLNPYRKEGDYSINAMNDTKGKQQLNIH